MQSLQESDWPGRLEIVIVDDASTDQTADVMAKLASEDDRIIAVNSPQNAGPAHARNLGLEHATGDWFAVLDADDAYEPGRLTRLVSYAEEEGLDIISDLLLLYDLAAKCYAPDDLQYPASGALQELQIEDFLQADEATGLDFGMLKPIFHRSLLEKGLLKYPSHLRHGEDCALYISMVQAGARFGLLHEAHYVFSTRIGAVSQKISPGSVTDVDYRAIATEAERLRDELQKQGSLTDSIADLLARRVSNALSQNRRYGWTMLRRKEWGRLVRWFRRNPRNFQALASVLLQKLLGHRGLPD